MQFPLTTAVFVMLLGTAATAQTAQTNGAFHALNVNDSAANAVSQQTPISFTAVTDTPLQVNASATPNTPVILLVAGATIVDDAIDIAAVSSVGVQIDLADVGSPGYFDQIVVDGYAVPSPFTYTDANGDFSVTAVIPACQPVLPGFVACISSANFAIAAQAVVVDASVPPIGLSATGAVQGTFINGYQEFPTSTLANDGFAPFFFKDGFTFNFYGGGPYAFAYVSENGYIQFGNLTGLNSFADASVLAVNQTGPRIMSYFSELAYTQSPTTSIYAQQFRENGTTKVRFVHQRVAEFGSSTGGHGGTVTITDQDEIAVFVASYNMTPSINVAVGISKGSAPLNLFQNLQFGRDLSNDVITGPTPLGADAPGFEVFDQSFVSPVNPIDLIGQYLGNGSSVGPGIVFTPDPALPSGQSGYVVQ